MEEGGFEPPNSERAVLQTAAFSHFARPPEWRETESNRRHKELQSFALPTELSSHLRSLPDSNRWSPPWQGGVITTTLRDHIAGIGFEPMTFGLWARRATRLLHPAMIKEDVGFGPTRGQNPPDGFQDRSLQPDLGNPPFIPSFNMVMTRTRFELMLPPWKGGVLTTWPTGHTFLTYLLIIPDLESDVNNFFQKLFWSVAFSYSPHQQ